MGLLPAVILPTAVALGVFGIIVIIIIGVSAGAAGYAAEAERDRAHLAVADRGAHRPRLALAVALAPAATADPAASAGSITAGGAARRWRACHLNDGHVTGTRASRLGAVRRLLGPRRLDWLAVHARAMCCFVRGGTTGALPVGTRRTHGIRRDTGRHAEASRRYLAAAAVLRLAVLLHFAKQNLGMVASRRLVQPGAVAFSHAERLCTREASGLAGIGGLSRPSGPAAVAGQLPPRTAVLCVRGRVLHRCVAAACVAATPTDGAPAYRVLRDVPDRPAVLPAGVRIFSSSPYAAVSGMTIAHGDAVPAADGAGRGRRQQHQCRKNWADRGPWLSCATSRCFGGIGLEKASHLHGAGLAWPCSLFGACIWASSWHTS